jgi:hypothetical protein
MRSKVSVFLRETNNIKNSELLKAYRKDGKKMEESQLSRIIGKGIRRYHTAQQMSDVLFNQFRLDVKPENLLGYE